MAFKKFIDADCIRKEIDGNHYCKEYFGCFFDGTNTDIGKICEAAEWGERFLNGKIPSTITTWVLADQTSERFSVLADCIAEIETYLASHTNTLAKLQKFGDLDDKFFFGQPIKSAEISRIIEKYVKCLTHLNSLFLWCDYCRVREKAISFGLSEVINAFENGSVPPKAIADIVNYSIYGNMARDIVKKHEVLSSFTTAAYDGIKRRFAELDKKIMNLLSEEIAFKTSMKSVPEGVGTGKVGEFTEKNLLTLEINKKKRHISTRRLVRRAGNALKAYKPCFMMSPLSVAQYLPPGQIEFDLILMDEASQIRPEDALGAFARGKRVVIVGDSNQLPPTTFFDRINEGYDEDEAIAMVGAESILDISRTIYRLRRLRWHYRSEHESLISFSNNEFYDNDLVIFPSPTRSNSQLGIRSHYIKDAKYSKGRNLPEAQYIVNAIIDHFEDNPDVANNYISLGVATFNREQRDLIEELLDKKRKQNSWFDNIIKETENMDEPFFIKNLENVQGDERDVIFISFTYGPDASSGKVAQRFGPINSDVGHRRLNVIFTRAKKRVEVFTSMLPTDLIITDGTSRGVRVMRSYLDYALTGKFNDFGEISNSEPDSDFEIAVAKILHDAGYKTAYQVGVAGFFIDIGIVHPQRESDFILGVECDGATYHSGKSVRDRDRLRQEILEKKGWRIHRIWSTDWFKNRAKEIERLIKAVKKAEEEDNIKFEFVRKPPKPSHIQAQSPDVPPIKRDDDLRKELLDYKKVNIDPIFRDQSHGILRDEMIYALVKYKPTTKEDFLALPLALRESIDSKQGQFLKDILQIIEEYI